MCGIAGQVDLTGQQRAALAQVRAMCDRITHRGPDGAGYYVAPGGDPACAPCVTGMRRLSIIDVQGSDQPLYNEDHSIALVFNGEIYNYRELRADLQARGHSLRTAGDGETIIHLYEEYGLALFSHLRGMYAFALWDVRSNRALLAVDHIGMKPLYLAERDGLLSFASEVKALFAAPAGGSAPAVPRLNLAVLDTYLSFGYMIGADTLFTGVRRLPPGHALVVESGSMRLHRFWQFGTGYVSGAAASGAEAAAGRTDWIAPARALLAESVRLHLRSDVPLGLFLSGGVDSAAVLALMAAEVQQVKTYTVGYAAETPDNELDHARRVAAHFNTEHHERIITAADWWQGLLKYIYHHDEPNANPSAVSLLLLAEMTGRQVKVVLTGLGGDELFGGYPHHHSIPALLAHYAANADARPAGAGLRRQVLGWLENSYPLMKRYRYIGALPYRLPNLRYPAFPRDEALRRLHSFDGIVFSDGLRERLYGEALQTAWAAAHHKEQTYAGIVAHSWAKNGRAGTPQDAAANTAQALIINTWLTGNALLNCDKVTMAASLEARVPLFDPALLDFAARVPPAVRMQANKVVLREAVRPLLPDFALARPKQPFGTPIRGWFEHDLRAPLRETLLDSAARIRPLFNRPVLEKLLTAHFSGRARYEEVVFRLLTLELWMQTFGITAG